MERSLGVADDRPNDIVYIVGADRISNAVWCAGHFDYWKLRDARRN
jgi:hypothetical protein